MIAAKPLESAPKYTPDSTQMEITGSTGTHIETSPITDPATETYVVGTPEKGNPVQPITAEVGATETIVTGPTGTHIEPETSKATTALEAVSKTIVDIPETTKPKSEDIEQIISNQEKVYDLPEYALKPQGAVDSLTGEPIPKPQSHLAESVQNVYKDEQEQQRYTIHTTLGEGMQSKIVRAYDRKLGRVVAIKITENLGNWNQPEYTVGQKEAMMMPTEHPHPRIVETYDFYQKDGKSYMVMEHLPERDYTELREKNESVAGVERFSIDETQQTINQTMEAVEYLHKNNTVHGDLKPENILIGPDGVKIADFGVSGKPGEWLFGKTVTYAPPEVFTGEQEQLSNSIDIYSVTTMTYEMLTGESPQNKRITHIGELLTENKFDPEKIVELKKYTSFKKRYKDKPEALKALQDKLGGKQQLEHWDNFFASAFSLDVTKRPKTVQELQMKLDILFALSKMDRESDPNETN